MRSLCSPSVALQLFCEEDSVRLRGALFVLAAVVATLVVPSLAGAQGHSPTLPPQAQAVFHRPDHSDITPMPLRDMVDHGKPSNPRGGRDFEPGRPMPVGHENPDVVDPLAGVAGAQTSLVAAPMAATIGTAVDPSYRVAPPDTTGDLGPNHYVQWVNLRYAVYNLTRDANKQITGFSLANNFPKQGNTIWQGFGGRCESDNDGDPIVQYDQFADRWILTQFAVSATPYTQCVAVSTSPDPTGSFYRYSYSYGTDFNDYPKMGVWSDAYYITYNIFKNGSTFGGSRVCAFDKAKMLVGDSTAGQVCATTSTSYGSLLPADIEGTQVPAAGTPNYLLSIGTSTVQFWKFAVKFPTSGTPTGTLTGPTTVPVATFTRACNGGTCIPQLGSSQKLDSLADRLMYRLTYRKLDSGAEYLLVNHSVSSGKVSGIRWYQLDVTGGKSPTVYKQGTYQPDTSYRWMGSAAMDKIGGVAIGYNVSSSKRKPGIAYAVMAPGAGTTLGGEVSVLVGQGSQQRGLSRWGDYSTISVDPTDGCQMVFTGEYIPSDGTFNWTTYIVSLKLSGCQ